MVYNICRSLLRMIYALLFRLEASGTENIPANRTSRSLRQSYQCV